MKRIKYIILLLTAFTLNSNAQMFGIDGVKIHTIQNPPSNTTPTSHLVSVIDLNFNTADQKYIDDMIVENVIGLVKLEFNHDNASLVPDFNLELPIQVEGFKNDGSSFTLNKTLAINYNSNKGEIYSDLAILEIPNTVLIDIIFTQSYTLSPSNISLLDLKEMITLSASIEKTAYLPFDRNLDITTNKQGPVSGEIIISWPIQNGAKEYDLEWTHISNKGYVNGNVVNINPKELLFNFNTNSSRVTLKRNTYEIPLLYEDGYLLWRVRAIGVVEDNGEIKEIVGKWNFEQETEKRVSDFLSTTSDQHYLLEGHEDDLNWQSSVTFAEDGKNKVVISYSDGTLRSRQMVTKLNTDTIIVVGETKYDAQGRAAIQILPVPVYIGGINQKVKEIQFVDNFNLTDNGDEFNWEQFDINDGQCNQNQIPLSMKTGASNYYSDNNFSKNLYRDNIPHAKGFPYTRIEYMPDNSGKIRRTSGLGPHHKLDSEHESKFFYTTPSQARINRLFGTDAGYAGHYQLNYTIDPNGQAALVYLDAKDNVVATSLLEDAKNKSLEDLESISNPINTTTYIDSLPSFTNDLSITSAYQFISTDDSKNIDLYYDFKGNTYSDDCKDDPDICYDCIYDLYLSVKDDCGNELITPEVDEKLPNTKADFKCNTSASFNLSKTLTLDEGTFTIFKELSVNNDSLEIYADHFIENLKEECGQEIKDKIYIQESSKIDLSGCNDCAPDIEGEVLEGCEEEVLSNCSFFYKVLKLDMTPGGQYATYDIAANGNYTCSDQTSIFYNQEWQKFIYDNSGNAPASLSINDFIDNFQEEWVDILITKHPEYCYYEFCDIINPKGQDYELEMKSQDSAIFVTKNGKKIADYLNPFGQTINNPTHIHINQSVKTTDPFLTYLYIHHKGLFEDMKERMEKYAGKMTIWEYARYLTDRIYNDCNNPSAIFMAHNKVTWEYYKSFYLALRYEYVVKARELYAKKNRCTNRDIGKKGAYKDKAKRYQSAEEIFSQVPEFNDLDFSDIENGIPGLENTLKDILDTEKCCNGIARPDLNCGPKLPANNHTGFALDALPIWSQTQAGWQCNVCDNEQRPTNIPDCGNGAISDGGNWVYDANQEIWICTNPSIAIENTPVKSATKFNPKKGKFGNVASLAGTDLCCDTSTLKTFLYTDPCDSILRMHISANTEMRYQLYLDSLREQFIYRYKNKCMDVEEVFTNKYTETEHHFTLYYYDQSNNLVMTVPPKAVQPFDLSEMASINKARNNGNSKRAVHNWKLATNYTYNSLNQLTSQKSPDGGLTYFWHDDMGRNVLSQNVKQRQGYKFTYTIYDVLNRVIEVGEIKKKGYLKSKKGKKKYSKSQFYNTYQKISKDPNNLEQFILSGSKSQITHTYYDSEFTAVAAEFTNGQQNLRNRIAGVTIDHDGDGTYEYGTFYSYDIHGNVYELIQHNKAMPSSLSDHAFKKMNYEYDLVSGNVNAVHYQDGKEDQFHHKYMYDEANRITDVLTSSDGMIWKNDARYFYYEHGALARMELGDENIQGVDYAYNLQGWIKGVNSTALTAEKDMGHDGLDGSINSTFATDAFSYGLSYYNGDYNPIGSSDWQAKQQGSGMDNGELFNGNIRNMTTSIEEFRDPHGSFGTKYTYDQLNRIKTMQSFQGLDNTTNSWGTSQSGIANAYNTEYTYDANGNILSLNRKTEIGTPLDNLSYNYIVDKNQLEYVQDAAGIKNNDIGTQNPNNYTYDAIGNLIKDNAEGITNIDWSLYGKIMHIIKSNDTISFTYDPTGNRIKKETSDKNLWYVRDASGNVMAIYRLDYGNDMLYLQEQPIYGSKRIASNKLNKELTGAVAEDYFVFTRANKQFELSNHLGNVLTTVSDKKLQVVDVNNTTQISHFKADILTANDYYPFGMQMENRDYSLNNTNYTFGFNGKEMDNEVSGSGNQYDFGARIYNPRISRFLSVDPLTKNFSFYTPYHFAGNKPINNIDKDGESPLNILKGIIEGSAEAGLEVLSQWAVEYFVNDHNSWSEAWDNLPLDKSAVAYEGVAGVFLGTLGLSKTPARIVDFTKEILKYITNVENAGEEFTVDGFMTAAIDGLIEAIGGGVADKITGTKKYKELFLYSQVEKFTDAKKIKLNGKTFNNMTTEQQARAYQYASDKNATRLRKLIINDLKTPIDGGKDIVSTTTNKGGTSSLQTIQKEEEVGKKSTKGLGVIADKTRTLYNKAGEMITISEEKYLKMKEEELKKQSKSD